MLHAQHDVIYPSIGKVGIRKCTITKVDDGNRVHYVKDSISTVIEAVAIRRDGKYTTLYSALLSDSLGPIMGQTLMYKGKSYDFYAKEQRSSLKIRNIGMGLTLFGLSSGIVGGLILNPYANNSQTSRVATALYIGGGIVANIGIILWVSGGSKAANNSRAMKRAKSNANISLGTTNNGIGLLLTFNT